MPRDSAAEGADAIAPAPQAVEGRSLALDILRIAAALCVVAYHWSFISGTLPAWLLTGMRVGYLGADLFFILSGAVIIHSVVGRTWQEFARIRFLRLFPLYVAATLLVGVFRVITDPGFRPAPNLWLGVTGVQFWLNVDPIIGAAWTLRYEIGFYLLVTILIIASRNRVTMRTVRIGVYGFLIVWLFSWATQLQVVQFLVLDQYGPLFVLGVLLGTARDVPTLRANGPALFVAGTLAFWTLLGRTGGNGWPLHSQVLLAVFLLVLPIVVILWASLRSSREPRAPRLHRWVAIGALMTYPLYLLHNELGVGIVSGLVHAGIAPRFAHAAGIGTVLLLSLLSVLLFEPWARRAVRRLFGWTVTDSGGADLRPARP